jgi:hypothetical protein
MLRTLKRLLAYFLITSLGLVGFAQSVQATLISTEQAVATATPEQNRARIMAALQRPDVQAEFEKLGVSSSDAKARVAALTDEEAATLASKAEHLPAGGDGIIGAILLVFFVLLLTDILGFTKVFPFTHPVHR